MVSALVSGLSGPGSSPGARFSKAPELFGPVKPFLDHPYPKTEKCIRLKLLV